MTPERILFIDRDGTLVEEPHDEQVDSLAKIRLLPGVIPALLDLKRAGYRFVLVSNQDGLGTDAFPEHAFREPQDFLRELFASQGIEFVEEAGDSRGELAAVVTRSPSAQAAAWPVVTTTQVDGICREVIAPAPDLDGELAAEATRIALQLAGDLDVVGVLAVEMFEATDAAGRPRVLVNELAMRPHNSGHWSIDGAVTSQFEQHLRAVLDLPLGDPRARCAWTVMVNVLGGDHPELYRSYLHVMARDPGVKVHLYGKGVRPGRKIGHVTVCTDDPLGLDDALARARHAADFIAGVIDE